MINITTDSATNIGVTKAKLNGHWTGDEDVFTIYFEWKYGLEGGAGLWYQSGAYGYEGSFSFGVSGLRPVGVYYFRAGVSTAESGLSWGAWVSFTTNSPTVETEPATGVQMTEATLHGYRITDYLNWVRCRFEWKKGVSGTVYSEYNTVYGSGLQYSSRITGGLISDSIYYFRFSVEFFLLPEPEWFYGEWRLFITQSESKVITDPATNIENINATLNGRIIVGTADDDFIERGFYWKKDGDSETKVIVELNGDIYSKVLTELEPGTLCYFKAFGKCESSNIYFGEQLSFTTTSIVPTVSTQIATDIEPLSVTGNGTIEVIGGGETFCSERGFEVRYTFSGTLEEYEAWKGHGFTGDVIFNSSTGLWDGILTKSYVDSGVFSATAFIKVLDDLICDKEYTYRAKSKNTVGWGFGSYLAFTTNDLLLRKSCVCGIFTIMLCAYVKPIPLGSVIKRRGFRWGIYNSAQEYDIHEDGDFPASAIIGPIDTISFVNSADDSVYDTIVDSAGGFLTAEFEEGKFIDVSATGAINPANEGQFKIISVTADTITVNVRNTLVSEAVTGVTIVELYALYIVDLDPGTGYYSVAYVAIEDSEGNWTVQEGNVALTTTITNIFGFEGYDRVEFYKPGREQNYRKITRKIEAEIIAEQQYIEKAGGRRFLPIKNHLIQTKENAIVVGTNYRDRFQEIKSLMSIEFPTPAPFQREDTLDIGFGRIRFKKDDKGIVNFMLDGEGLMLFRYRMVMMIRKINMDYVISKEDIDYMATMELEEA